MGHVCILLLLSGRTGESPEEELERCVESVVRNRPAGISVSIFVGADHTKPVVHHPVPNFLPSVTWEVRSITRPSGRRLQHRDGEALTRRTRLGSTG